MEDNQNPQNQTYVQPTENTNVLRVNNDKRGGKKSFVIVLLIASIILIIGGVLYLLGSSKKGKTEASPTPDFDSFATIAPEVEEATPTPVSKEIERSEIAIEILNGTGTAKEASFVQNLLKDLGYEDFKVGNASPQSYTDTEVTFKTGVLDDVKTEIVSALTLEFAKIKSTTSSSITTDVKIITGTRKGATPVAKATATATAKATASPTASAKPSPSPTATTQ